MFAVLQSGGKQYRVAPNDVIVVDKLDAPSGKNYDFSEILIIGDNQNIIAGAPFVEGAVVKTKVIEQRKSDTTIVFKKKRRHNYRRLRGHRQDQTVVRIIEILGIKKTKKTSSEIKNNTSTKDAKPKTRKITPKPKKTSPKE